MSDKQSEISQTVDKEAVKKRMLEEAKSIRIRRSTQFSEEGEYKNENPYLEHKSKWQEKADELEKKYDGAKIQFHILDDEGEMKLSQAKRDKLFSTLGWSFIGNFFGIAVVRSIEKRSEKYKALRHFQKRELFKVFGFFGAITAFTIYGYGTAQQQFVKDKVKIVKEHSKGHTDK